MNLFDTHTHLYLPEFDVDRESVMKRAISSGVTKMLFPNVDCSTLRPMKELHESYPENTFMAIGLHPTEVDDDSQAALEMVESELRGGCYVAVGEIGIDLYWDKTYRIQQIEAFRSQVNLAVKHQLPIIIHCREGLSDTVSVLSQFDGCVSGVFHSFGGSVDDVDAIRKTGDFYFGINGIVTFKNSKLRDVLPLIGLERILIETDAPYLAPVPYRGKRNESSYIVETARVIADVFDVTLEHVATVTYENAEKLFLK